MYRATTRWTTAVAAAALMALPVAASAQSSATPPQQPPTQTQPQQQTPPPKTAPPETKPPEMQPPPTQEPASPAKPAASGQADQAAAKKHLSDARDTLSQLTALPEAAKLQGESRTQVSQLISNFNELITTQTEWRAAYAKVDANLTSLLGPDAGAQPATAGTAGAVGTSGSAAAADSLDPAIRAKLAEFRAHLKLFEQSAGATPGAEAAAGAMPPAGATGSTSNPANPTVSGTPTNPDPSKPGEPPAAAAAGTAGVTPSPTAGMNAADQAKAAEQVGHAEADKHLDAISAILNNSKTGALTRAQTAELKKHVAELRRLLQQPNR